MVHLGFLVSSFFNAVNSHKTHQFQVPVQGGLQNQLKVEDHNFTYWGELTPGKPTFKAIYRGYDSIYNS